MVKWNFEHTFLDRIYQDDNLEVFSYNMKKKEVTQQLDSSQKAIKYYMENNFLQLIVMIRSSDKDDLIKHEKINTDKNDYFPYLDMKMFWF